MGEGGRVAGLDREKRRGTGPGGSLQFGFGASAWANSDRAAAAGTSRQVREGIQGRFGAAEMIDEFAKRDGSDVVRADEAQAGEALGVVERRDRQRCTGEQVVWLRPWRQCAPPCRPTAA